MPEQETKEYKCDNCSTVMKFKIGMGIPRGTKGGPCPKSRLGHSWNIHRGH
jgi:hypothetical protein